MLEGGKTTLPFTIRRLAVPWRVFFEPQTLLSSNRTWSSASETISVRYSPPSAAGRETTNITLPVGKRALCSSVEISTGDAGIWILRETARMQIRALQTEAGFGRVSDFTDNRSMLA